MSSKGDMLRLVAEWRQVQREISNDGNLSDAGKHQKRVSADERYRAELRDWGVHELNNAVRAVERAESDYTAARRAQVNAGDGAWARQVALHIESEAWARSVATWQDARSEVQDAIADGDAARVRSLQKVALPELLRRARNDASLRQDNATVAELKRELDTAADVLRPAELRAAESALQAARQFATQVMSDLHSVDLETAAALGNTLRGGGGVLSDILGAAPGPMA